MKAYILFSLLSFSLIQSVLAQEDISQQINYIREVFKETENLCKTISPVFWRSDTLLAEGPIEFREWRYNSGTIKFQMTQYYGKDKKVSDFYFGDGELIFAFTQDFLRDEFGNQYIQENRYYFRDEDTLIRWINEDKNEVNPNSIGFVQRGSEVWSDIHWSREVLFMNGISQKNSLPSFTISAQSFYGITLGRPISDFFGQLQKGILETGEGTFDVYYIQSTNNEELGYILENEKDHTVLSIVITSSKGLMDNDIAVGSTYQRFREVYPQAEINRSEIESRFFTSSGNFVFFFDGYALKDPVHISSIVIHHKHTH